MIATETGGPSQSSRAAVLRLWWRLPAALRGLLSGFFVFETLQLGWMGAFLANTKYLPQIPWNIPAGLLYMWLLFSYFNGRGWPGSTAGARRVAMRARKLSTKQWLWSLLYCLLCLVFMAAILNVVYRFITVPDAAMLDTSMLPWWTLYPSLVMLSVNAGVSEEAGFRGYLQGALERRYGPVTAIVATSTLFWAAHLNRPGGLERLPYLVGFSIATGALAWALQSIWPAIVAHALVDVVALMAMASGMGPDWLMRKPARFAETGADGPFVVFSILLVVSVLAGISVLRRVRRSRTEGSLAEQVHTSAQ